MQNSSDWLSRSHPWKSHEKYLKIKPIRPESFTCFSGVDHGLVFYYIALLKNTYWARRLSLLWNSILIKNETYKKFTNLHAFHLIIVPIPLHSDKNLQSKRKTPIYSFKGLSLAFRPLPKLETKTKAMTIKCSGWSTQLWSIQVTGQLVEVVIVHAVGPIDWVYMARISL